MPTAVSVQKFFRIAAGQKHTCALLKADSTAYCWGRGTEGQLGQGAFTSSGVPVAVGGGFQYIKLVAGDEHTCGVRWNAPQTNVYCWGLNSAGQVGNGNNTNQSSPAVLANVALLGTPVVVNQLDGANDIAAGSAHTCVHEAGAFGHLLCWGDNSEGQLGDWIAGAPSSNVPYIAVSGGDFSLRLAAAGGNTTCVHAVGALGFSPGLYCFGRNAEGQMGTGDRVSGDTPRLVQ